MNESRIIKSIKFHAIKHYLNGEYWQVDTLFAWASAIIFPFLNQIEYDHIVLKQPGTIQCLVKELAKFCKQKQCYKQRLCNLSFDGLVNFFDIELCPKLSQKVKEECLKEAISLIASFGEEGFISWRGNSKVYDTIIRSFKNDSMLYEYGSESFQIKQAESDRENYVALTGIEEETAKKLARKARSQKTTSTGETEEEKALNKFWCENIFGDYYEECMPYVWKLRIPFSIYIELKSKLHVVCMDLKPDHLYERHSEKLLVYIAEWYKWEYVGRDENAFEGLGVSETASRIWGNVEKWQSFRYSGDSGDRDIHLYSIYALGGLPLRYVKESSRGGKFDVAFESILNRDEIETIVNKLSDAITNLSAAFKKSLRDENGSWRKFTKKMAENPESLYNDADTGNNKYVKFFYERLENGRRGSVDKVIKHYWIFYTSQNCEDITGDFIVEVGQNGSNGCVAAEVINSVEEQLYIGIECQDEILKCRKYSRTHDGKKYVGWGTPSNRMRGYIEDLSQPINVCKYNISQLQAGKGEKVKSFELGNELIELYAMDDDSSWTTLRDIRGEDKDTAVLFPNSRFEIESDNKPCAETKLINGEPWTLLKVVDALQVKDKKRDETITIHPKCEVSIRLNPQIETIKYYDSTKSLVKCHINGKEKVLPLIMGVPDGQCITWFGNDNKVKKVHFKDQKYDQNTRRGEVIGKKQPEPGVITLHINDTGLKKEYIYLPKDSIKRNWEKGTITFDNLSKVKIEQVHSSGDIEQLNSNVYKDIDVDKLKTDDVLEDTLQFRIYFSEFNYVELEVYRPIYCRELSLNGRVIKRYNDTKQRDEIIALPYVLRNKFDLRIFDEKGVSYLTQFRDMRWFLLCRPQQTIQRSDKFDIYLYANRHIEDKKGVLGIGARGIEQYKFYYWSVKDNEKPYVIKTSYDGEKQHLIVPTECLKHGGLIFQSLNGCTPRHYVMPLYANENWTRLVDVNYSPGLVYQCFKIAVEHRVPFTQFYPLHYAVKHSDNLYDLYKKVVADRSYSKTDKYVSLHRFANEFGFEWILMPKRFWQRQYDQAIELIENSCFINTSTEKQLLRRAVSYLFSHKLPEPPRGRGNEGVKEILRYMNGNKQMLPITDENISSIEKLYRSKEWISKLLSIFENN